MLSKIVRYHDFFESFDIDGNIAQYLRRTAQLTLFEAQRINQNKVCVSEAFWKFKCPEKYVKYISRTHHIILQITFSDENFLQIRDMIYKTNKSPIHPHL